MQGLLYYNTLHICMFFNRMEVVSGEDDDNFKVPKKYCIAQEPVIMEEPEPPGNDVPATATATEKMVRT